MFFLIYFFFSFQKKVSSYYQRQIEQIELPCDQYKQQFTDFYLSSISYYYSSQFDFKENTQNTQRNICDQDCPPNCCVDLECEQQINANGNIAIPQSDYFIITGGLIEKPNDIQECILSSKCFNLLNQHIYYGNTKNFKVDILQVQNFQSVYMHASVVVIKDDECWLYYIGGKCQQQSECNKLKRFRIPTKPISQEKFRSQVELIGNDLPFSDPLIGSSLIYDQIQDRILLYGGFIVKENNLQDQNQIYKFQFDNQIWQKIPQKIKTQKIISLNDQQKIFEVPTQKPKQFLYSLLTFNAENQLLIIGGFDQKNFEFFWQQKMWIFDEINGTFIENTPAYMYFDQQIDFNLDHFPNQLAPQNDFMYLDYQRIADFNQLKQDTKRGYFYLKNNEFIFIVSRNVYIKNTYVEECFDQIETYQSLTGENLIYDCYGNGTCKDKQCLCDQGFSGNQCEIVQCLDECNLQLSSQNTCLQNFPQSYCHCDLTKNYGGPNCHMKFCINDCSFNGKCNYQNGQCICDQHFKMSDCSVFEIEM